MKLKTLLLSALFALNISVYPLYAEVKVTPVNNREYLPALLNLINTAKKEIYISQYLFNNDITTSKIKTALKNAYERKVTIKILFENSVYDNADSFRELSFFGIETKMDTKFKKTHQKLVIADNQVLFGSTNFSKSSIDNNNETNILLSGADIAGYFRDYFDKLWQNSNVTIKPETEELNGITILHGKKYQEVILNEIQNARKEVFVIMYNMKHYPGENNNNVNALINALAEAKNNGVQVKILLEKSGFDKELNKTNEETAAYLKQKGVNVKFDSIKTITHSKLIIIDNKTVISSSNWTLTAIKHSREISAVLPDPEISMKYKEYFNSLWNKY
ncbi:MAG: hypothetical protein A2252_06540 [Elusimicrobia bacterium RIFOXYA2_FULL_39_19]|nr:MAG: hypothetical protein A2252_06540 [Elusimicrobia bacterium RIFOXYA2_FULL_39_19]